LRRFWATSWRGLRELVEAVLGPFGGWFGSSLRLFWERSEGSFGRLVEGRGRLFGGVVRELFETVLGDLSEGSWGARRAVREGARTPPPRGVWRACRAMDRHPLSVVAAVAEGRPKGSAEPPAGASAEPGAEPLGRPPQVVVEGHGGDLRVPARSTIRGYRGCPRATRHWASRGRSRDRAKAVVAAAVERAALGLATSSRVSSSAESAGCHWPVVRPWQDLVRTRRTGVHAAVRPSVTVV
jgi:hypothetical protein